jgi:hypothetical protein
MTNPTVGYTIPNIYEPYPGCIDQTLPYKQVPDCKIMSGMSGDATHYYKQPRHEKNLLIHLSTQFHWILVASLVTEYMLWFVHCALVVTQQLREQCDMASLQ